MHAHRLQVTLLAPEALELSRLRKQHASLCCDAAEARLLAQDSHVLKMQASVMQELQQKSGARERSEEGDNKNGISAGTVEAADSNIVKHLEGLFARMRALEAEQLGQQVCVEIRPFF
jgi:hypothetical protein